MGRLTLLALVLPACGVPRDPVDRAFADVDLQPPTLDSATVTCDAEASRWVITLRASAWTGGATSAWSADGAYVELHPIPRISWAEDGTGETLELKLPIVDDWREVTANTTVFTCAQDPSGALELLDTDGEVTDCRAWGPDPAVFDTLDDTPSCDTLLP